MFPARFELATFRVLGGRDNHYTTETAVYDKGRVWGIIGILSLGRTRKFIPLVWYKGGGGGRWMEPLPGVFWYVAVFWNDFTLSGQDEVYFRGGGAAGGLWRHQ